VQHGGEGPRVLEHEQRVNKDEEFFKNTKMRCVVLQFRSHSDVPCVLYSYAHSVKHAVNVLVRRSSIFSPDENVVRLIVVLGKHVPGGVEVLEEPDVTALAYITVKTVRESVTELRRAG